MKKITMLLIVSIISFISLTTKTLAEESYYINSNNVSFTRDEYDFISNFIWNGYQDYMTESNFNYIFGHGISPESFIEESNYEELGEIALLSTTHSSASKTISIRKACSSSQCLISVVAEWKTIANVRSYDVMGAYLDGTNLIYAPETYIVSENGLEYSNEIKYDLHGFGVSFKLPNKNVANYITINQQYYVGTSGNVYASYQHAKSTTTLANSKKYSISLSGYGKVFNFESSVINVYDGMGGVNISL